ncbi:MAG: AraC family transcriptional regulator, partial [Planctomycetota bacterium]
ILIMRMQHHPLRERFPSLRSSGFAAQDFPTFRSRSGQLNIHDVAYASLLLSGTARHLVGSEEVEDRPGSLTVVAPGVAHRIDSGGATLHVINCYLDLAVHGLPPMPADCAHGLHGLFPILTPEPARGLVQVQLQDPAATAHLLQALIAVQGCDGAGAEARVRSIGTAILIDCARAVLDRGLHLPLLQSEPIRQVAALIDRRYAEDLTVADCAVAAGWSEAHCSRRFKAATGRSVIETLQRRRIEAAAQALRAGPERVIDIAFDCGFRDLAHFNRCFKRLLGCTPRQWRAGADGLLDPPGRAPA